ncbi:uncharacterized protein LOC116290181 isoform X2 [Actinia tenebrosa]|nr:uncharacterized protein LOC116290181 isoform X2 [Actinia tenebrosa]XP_031553037.1 uncharacterized protein LOC116290181 isoform X2 [Actinia tenebrosa]XP_031553038.1 uncharacterized protein LOC116290181 isoform X2 [Actinia tenebrosa]XP_031553039.1 uncharacterized protein LOC116290181 isoform X2 [Actinia tenebrosa]
MYLFACIFSFVMVPSMRGSSTTPLHITTTTAINTTNTSTAQPNSTISTIVCVKPCSCYVNKNNLITIRCQLDHLPRRWALPTKFKSLDLSNNNLTAVPSNFFKKQNLSHLLSLSLQRNPIKLIEEDAFMGLESLQWLDLSFISLQEWKGNISRSIPSLRYLDVTGNSPWLPSDNVFAVHSIRVIKGVTWSSSCYNCTLTNVLHMGNTTEIMPPGPGGPGGNGFNSSFIQPTPDFNQGNMTGLPGPGGPGITPGNSQSNEMANTFLNKKGFFPSCNEVPMGHLCMATSFNFPSDNPLVLPGKLFYVAYVLGALAIILNFSIIFIYLYSTSMRKINSMLLISNMAFCDVLVGVYAIIIAEMNIFNGLLNRKPEEKLLTTWKIDRLCIVAGVLFTLGQVVAVITALLLTVDKFLSIVYCMDPNRKLSRRLSFLVLILCWVGAFIYALTPLFPTSSNIVYSPTLLCTLPVTEVKDSVISFGLLVALYLANIPFYGKIFLFVRRSSVRMGVRRDAVLAKKISLLIFTNMIFFAIPMIIIVVFSYVFKTHYKIEIRDNSAATWRYVIYYWMPVFCLCINSCLNPFLCAYRQRQFRREVKKCARNCFLNNLCKAFTTFRSDSSVRTSQPTRVEMYKLSNMESQAP